MPPARSPRHDTTGARVLLAGTAGALLAAGWSLATAPAGPSTGSAADAVVTGTASCVNGGRDTVSVMTDTGPVGAGLDACGQPLGTKVSVLLQPDGSVGEVVSLAGIRSGAGSSAVPVVVLAAITAITAVTGGAAAASVRAGRATRARG